MTVTAVRKDPQRLTLTIEAVCALAESPHAQPLVIWADGRGRSKSPLGFAFARASY